MKCGSCSCRQKTTVVIHNKSQSLTKTLQIVWSRLTAPLAGKTDQPKSEQI